MMEVVKVLRLGGKCARVQLEDGRVAKIPVEFLSGVDPNDLQEVVTGNKRDLVHKSLVKEKRVRTDPVLFNSLADWDAEKEIHLLKSLIVKNLDVLGRTLTPEAVEELAHEAFLHFWERQYYQRYNPAICKYLSYLSRGVRNFLIDKKRSSKYRHEQFSISLNSQLSEDTDAVELLELIADPREDATYSAEFHDFLEKCHKIAVQLDVEEPTGLEDVSYEEIFKHLFGLTKESFDDYASSRAYSVSTIKNRKSILISYLRPYYKEFMSA